MNRHDDPALAPVIHVYPVDDIREHDTAGTACWCAPNLEVEEAAVIVVHNSLDGREAYETAGDS